VEYLAQHIESLIFTCEHPISFKEIKSALEEIFEAKIKAEDITETLDTLMENYRSDQSSFEIVKIAGGYQFLTKGAFHATVGTYLKQTIKKRLSTAALETLAIVAYKQPVTKGDIENIRGVNCDYAVQKLLEKELVAILGRKEAPGRPLLYGASQKFLDYFGIEDLKDLPKIKEFKDPDNSIGEAAPIEENVEGFDGLPRRKDDVIDIAIAVADIYDPLPPREEEHPKQGENVEGQGSSQKEDDLVDIAIAVADIYEPLPPKEEDDPDDGGNEDDNGDGTPIADPTTSPLAEGASTEAVSQEGLQEESKEEETSSSSDEEILNTEQAPGELPKDQQVDTALEHAQETDVEASTTELEEEKSEGIVEFVEKTTGEFAGQTPEEINQENELVVNPENLIDPEGVTTENISSLGEDE